MQQWEYLQIEIWRTIGKYEPRFTVRTAEGEYFTDVEYATLDPKGHRAKDRDYEHSGWAPGMARSDFLLTVLRRLGSEGWDAVGNTEAGQYTSVNLLLKRSKGR